MAGTMQGWSETVIIMVLVVIVATILIGGFNDLYSEDHQLAGLNTSAFEKSYEDYQTSAQTKIEEGDAGFIANTGLVLVTSWDLIGNSYKIIKDFVLGGWIRTIIVDYMRFGEAGEKFAFILRGIYFTALIFIILKILFKVPI